MKRLDSTSTRRAKDCTTSSSHNLMTPPPTPRKPRDNPKHDDAISLRHLSNVDMPKQVFKSKSAARKANRRRRRQKAHAAKQAHNNVNKSVKHIQLTLPYTPIPSTPTPLPHTAQNTKAACTITTEEPIVDIIQHVPHPTAPPLSNESAPVVDVIQRASHPADSPPSSKTSPSLDITQQVPHPAASPHFSSAAPSLDLERLMTLHFQRYATFHAHPSNPLEELLAVETDDFEDPDSQDSTFSPTLAATHEFIRAMQHEQSELCKKTDALELRLRKMKKSMTSSGPWGLITAAHDRDELRRLERMLGLSIALCFELLLEEGAFRDVCDKKMGEWGFDLGDEFRCMRGRVAAMVAEYDLAVGELRRGG